MQVNVQKIVVVIWALCGIAAVADSLSAAQGLGMDWPSRTLPAEALNTRGKPPVITALALHPDGRTLAAAGDDHLIYLWDLREERVLQRLEGHTDWVHTLSYHPRGKALASAGLDRRVLFWDAATGARLYTHEDPRHAVTKLAWSGDGTTLAATGFENKLRIYSVAERQLERELDCPCADMRAVAFSPDDALVAAGGRNGVIRIWRRDTYSLLDEYQAHGQRIRALLISPDGKQLVSSGEDRRINVWSLQDGRGFQLPERPAKVFSLAFVGPGRLAAGCSDNVIRLWDLSARREVGQLTGHKGSIAALACDGATLVSGSYDTTIRVWNIKERVANAGGNGKERK